MPRSERRLAAVLVLAAAVVRLFAVLHHRVNSDEPQHLQVAWAWTQGLLPYRDVFDNHVPTFSWVMSHALAAFGERPDIVVAMRFLMVPFAAVALWAVWVMGRRLFSERVAWWAVAIAGANAEFLIGSVEYRTDIPWMAAWLATLAVLVDGQLTRRRAFVAGLLGGLSFATSMKTSLLLNGVVAGALVTAFLARRESRADGGRVAGRFAAGLTGLVIVPGIIVAAFAAQGALHALMEGVFGFNVLPGLGLWGKSPLRPLGLVPAIPAILLLGAWVYWRADEPGRASRRAVLFMGAATAHALLECVWPLVVRGDLLPLVPVEAVFGAAVLADLARRLRGGDGARGRAWLAAALPALVVLLELAATIRAGAVWRDDTRAERRALADVLRLTRPGESVMTVKGEAVFRPRPIYPAIETIYEERFKRGLVRDDIPEQLVAHRTGAAVQYDARAYPARAWAFLQAHYLPAAELRVLGERLPVAPGNGVRALRIVVPQRYALVTAAGDAHGSLDGVPLAGPVELAVGVHRYEPAPGEREVAAVWAPAVERGYRPALLPEPIVFHAGDRLLVLAPHPDDEVGSNGGLVLAALHAGASVKVVFATAGQTNPWAQLAHEGRWPLREADRTHWGALRRAEAEASLATMGLPDSAGTWLGFTDRELTDTLMSPAGVLVDTLAHIVRRWRPTWVSAPSLFDAHPDHSAMAVATDLALARLGPDVPRPRLVAYRAHPSDLAPEPTLELPVPEADRATKLRAILRHVSQLHWRREHMLELASPFEGFEPPAVDIAARETHLVHRARLQGGALVVDYARGRITSLPPLVLRVASDDERGARVRATVTLPAREGTVPVTDAVRAAAGEARVTRVGRLWRVTLPMPASPDPRRTFVKVERPREQAWGFFDLSGWWPLAAASVP